MITRVVPAAGREAGLRYAGASQSCMLPWGCQGGSDSWGRNSHQADGHPLEEAFFGRFSSQPSGWLEYGFPGRVKGFWVGHHSVRDIDKLGRHVWSPGGCIIKRGQKADGTGANVL